ncbi:MAG: transcription termination/antitermination protein NusG [Deltaproteobacteria bacterium]|nr:transcription termination/antitermination protein NusG [Deltaproteobacteria bacterium]
MNNQTATAAAPATPKSDKLKWYVVHTYSGFENRAKKALEEKIKQVGLDAYFGEILIPMETVEEQRNGQKKTTKRKFAPGYIFVLMEMKAETWQLVKATPKVTGFIGAPNLKSASAESDLAKIPSVPEKQVMAMTQQLTETAVKPAPKIDFEAGDSVRVVEGPFANFSGNVEEVNHAKQKVRVHVTIFGRSTPVELDFNQIAKA